MGYDYYTIGIAANLLMERYMFHNIFLAKTTIEDNKAPP